MLRRGKLEIIRDILKILQDNPRIKPTPLLRKSGISSSRFKCYYNELIVKGFIKEIKVKERKNIKLTDKGFRFLEKYKSIADFIDEFEL